MTPPNRSAVVIGGGIAGLASAALLAAEGYDVDLLEQRPTLGGRTGTWESAGFRFDTGPSWYLMPEVFEHFYRLLGTSVAEQLELQQLDPAYRVFHEGQRGSVDIAADRQANVATFERIEPGAGRALERYLDSASEAYDMALAHFLYTTFASPVSLLHADVVRRAHRLLPLLALSLDRFIKQRFADRRLRQVLGYSSVFLGSSPRRTPSMYHLMSALDLTGGVLYPQGGFGRLIETIADLATAAGARVHTGARVTAVTTEPLPARGPRRGRTARVTGVRWRDAGGAEHLLRADVVVGAGDLHDLETRILDERFRTYPQRWWDRRVSGPGSVLAFLGVRGELPSLPHHSLFFTADWDANFRAIEAGRVPSPASVYVSRTSATDPGVAPPGHEAVVVLVPVPADPHLGVGGVDGAGSPAVEAIADAAVAQIASWAGVPDLADRIVTRRTVGPGDFARDLSAWRGGMLGPAHTLRQSAFLRGSNVSRRLEGLYYAGGSTIPGIGLPMCLISAELVLKRLRGDRSAGPLPEPLARTAAGAGEAGPAS